MEEYVVTAIVGAAASAISTFVTWVSTKRKYLADVKKREAEVDNDHIANIQRTMEFYQKLCDDTNARLQLVLEDNAKLRIEVDALKCNQQKLIAEISVLRSEAHGSDDVN